MLIIQQSGIRSMMALSGSTMTSWKTSLDMLPTKDPMKEAIVPSASSKTSYAPATQVFILEPRKSQNTAIVLRSLGMSRKEILGALLDGQGLGSDALEKLTKVAPTKEEEEKIIHFHGNPTKLADAESFLYHILKAVPTAFTRFKAMLFISNYDCEILQLNESLQTIELACKELRTRGLFFKLLEAILKAGNRMNAGTARGNAQGFNLTTLQRLSDVKSTDGKTTLLHFVVEQVARSEGRHCLLNKKSRVPNSNSQRSKIDELNSDILSPEEGDREYLMLGLPVLGSLNVELSEVKKAASIEYDSFISMSSTLGARAAEVRQVITCCGNGERGGFVKEIKGFLEECEEELKVGNEEQTRIIDLVKRTTEYYQAGASKDKLINPFQLFVIVKDFLDKVDQVCVQLNHKPQKNNVAGYVVSSGPSSSPIIPSRFPNLSCISCQTCLQHLPANQMKISEEWFLNMYHVS
ncbi:Formin-like protein [Quillaja saponaria]|uniref:Formin-like protein n=1 Tax=Quillaja saponaria TaxID=32244 RepID=A0AAD7P8G4_QUISA|nr:Formin-like protein [Quillaja saponaria]